MNANKYKRLKELSQQVKPYNPDGFEEEDKDRTQTNQEFFSLCAELVPILIECFEDYCSIDSNTVEDVIEGFGR